MANIIAGVTFGEGQETGGKIPAYQFSMSNEDGTWVEAAVTKQGGKLLWYMSPCKGNTEGKPDDAEGKRYADTALKKLEELGFGNLPICMAKTQYSFSDDPSLLGAPRGFTVTVRNLKVSAGAGFLVALTGDIMTMPGLPKKPAAENIDVTDEGLISGLF